MLDLKLIVNKLETLGEFVLSKKVKSLVYKPNRKKLEIEYPYIEPDTGTKMRIIKKDVEKHIKKLRPNSNDKLLHHLNKQLFHGEGYPSVRMTEDK